MASTFTTGFGIEKIGSGEQSGAWGTTTNHNLDIMDRIASYKAVALSGSTHTLTVREASPGSGTENLQDGMYRVIKFTGALGANNTVTIAPNTAPAYFIFENATTDSGSSGPYSVILTQGSGANITIQNGKNAIVYCDGAGSGAAVVNALSDLQIATLEVTGVAALDGAVTVGGASQFNSTVTVGVDNTGYDVTFFGATSGRYMLWDESADTLLFPDDTKVAFGTHSDLSIFHDGSNSYIQENGTGDLLIGATSFQIRNADFSENYLVAAVDGAVTLYHNNVARITTTANGTTSTGDIFTLHDTSTDANFGPYLDLNRDSASPADNDGMGIVRFLGDNDAGQSTHYAAMHVINLDMTDGTEDGGLDINTIVAGTVRSRLYFYSSQSIFNEAAQDIDLRVESSNNANMLFVDASGDAVGIGTAPNGGYVTGNKLEVNAGALGTTATNMASAQLLSATTSNLATLQSFAYRTANGSDHSTAEWRIQRVVDVTRHSYIGYGSTYLSFGTNATEQVRMDASGNVGIGTTSPTGKLQINGNANALFAMRTNGDTASNVMGTQYLNNSGAVTAQTFATGDNSSSGVFRIKAIGNIDLIGGDIGVTGAAPDLRVTTGGLVLAGATAIPGSATAARLYSSDAIAAGSGIYCKAGAGATTFGNKFNINWTGSAADLWIDTTNIGAISVSSDYRIKRNISTQTEPALNKIKALRPVTYQMADYGMLFKSNDAIKEGFIAHEVQEIIPSGADGVKDDENKIQSLKVDAILAVVVKAMQEQQVIIESLTARITALEG